jgi:hypothetical protein
MFFITYAGTLISPTNIVDPFDTFIEFPDSGLQTTDEGLFVSAADFPIWGENDALQSQADVLYGDCIMSSAA